MNTKPRRIIDPERVQKIVNDLFRGAQIDSFAVRSIVIEITFINSDSSGKLCQFRVTSLNHIDRMGKDEGGSPTDFHARRKVLFLELHSLLGQDASSACLDDSHRLIVSYTNISSLIFSNEPEEAFGSLDVNWSIDLDDEWERTPRLRRLSCVLSEVGEAEFFELPE